MYSKVVLNVFNNPKNAGRIKKPDGIADCYNLEGTAHVEFSLKIESGVIKLAQFRAQANPYIVAICSTITQMLKDKMVSTIFLDPFSIKTELGDESDIDIEFCIDCVKMAIDDYKEQLIKENKQKKKRKENSSNDEQDESDIPDLEGEIYGDLDDNLDTEVAFNNSVQDNKKLEEDDDDFGEEDLENADFDDDDFADFFDDIFEED